MRERTKNLIKYLLEFLIVAFGVFLGIYVSEWRNEKQTREDVETSIQFIIGEMKSNQKSLEAAVDYHTRIMESFDSIKNSLTEEDFNRDFYSNTKLKFDKIKGWEGIGLWDLEDIAFETAKISGTIREIDVKLIHHISKVYKLQDFYKELSKTTIDQILGINAGTKTIDVVGTFTFLGGDVLGLEKSLITEIEKARALLEKKL